MRLEVNGLSPGSKAGVGLHLNRRLLSASTPSNNHIPVPLRPGDALCAGLAAPGITGGRGGESGGGGLKTNSGEGSGAG